MKEYIKPEIKITEFAPEKIMLTSGVVQKNSQDTTKIKTWNFGEIDF